MERNPIHKVTGSEIHYRSKCDDLIQTPFEYKPGFSKFGMVKHNRNDLVQYSDKNDPFGYYISKIVEIKSSHWLYSQPTVKQVVRLKRLSFMQRNLASSTMIVSNHPVVLRGGGFAGRAGFPTHGLRFPPVS
jgi:hypothetical protein